MGRPARENAKDARAAGAGQVPVSRRSQSAPMHQYGSVARRDRAR